MKVSIGIDIGANGAWAMFVGDKLLYGKIPTTGDELDMLALYKKLKDTMNDNFEWSHPKCKATGKCQETESFKGTEHEGVNMCEDGCVWFDPRTKKTIHCVIEDLHAIFNSSASSNFTFGVNNGLIISMLQ